MDTLLIRKIGESYAIFTLSKMVLADTAKDEKDLVEVIQKLTQSDKTKSKFPSVGLPYWFVNLTAPNKAEVNEGVVTKEIMEQIDECGVYGNMFSTKQEAVEAAKRVIELFEEL